jgi:adenosylcobinamide kinase / adenosylcobinamide-phosphate guanylyltransferase
LFARQKELKNAMGDLILVTGGVRCGKSRFAERRAGELGGDRVVYIATAEAGDDEMRARIAAHRADRPASWRTLEAPVDVAAAIEGAAASPTPPRVILVDCLTMLVSNLLLGRDGGEEETASARVDRQSGAICAVCARIEPSVIVVTNEVGWGVVPSTSLGRRYRDSLGTANQVLAAASAQVYLLVAGIAVDFKALASAAAVVPRPELSLDRKVTQ